ncbi:MAG: UDP-N-acetylmuramate dehydrogenase [Pseudomonadota bacterium]
MVYKEQIDGLRKVVKGVLLTDRPMKEYTSWKVGGTADAIVFPKDLEDTVRIIKYLTEEQIPYFVLGNGTNLLVRDGGIRDIVISLSHGFKRIELLKEDKSPMLFAEAGVLLGSLIRFSIDHSLSGLEFAAGIPGTVGGGLAMNAGGHFGELKDITHSISILNRNGRIITQEREDLRFSYRNLQLSDSTVILSALFELKINSQSHIRDRIEKILGERKATQPLDLPSAGSIFKNPKGMSAGKLIDRAGLKGAQVGGAMVSERHANFILNLGNATAKDVLSLIGEIQEKVYQETGLILEPEIRIIGEN